MKLSTHEPFFNSDKNETFNYHVVVCTLYKLKSCKNISTVNAAKLSLAYMLGLIGSATPRHTIIWELK